MMKIIRVCVPVMVVALWLALDANFVQAQNLGADPSKCNLAAGQGISTDNSCEQSGSTSNESTSNAITSNAAAEANVVEPVPPVYTPSLNGAPPIQLQQSPHLRFLYGLSTSQGFDSAAAGPFRDLPTWVSAYDGYGAATWRLTKSYIVVQHASAFTHYGAGEIHGQSFHRTALLGTGQFNQKWTWNFEARNGIGDDQLRLTSPLPSRMLGEVSTPEPDSAVLGSTSGLIWGNDLSGALTFTPTQHNTFSLRVRNAYHRIYADNSHDDIATFRLEYQRRHSERLTYGVYGQTIQQRGMIVCSSSGGGIETAIKMTESSLLEVAAGPEVGSGGCRRQQGFNLHVAATDSLNPTTEGYVSVNREFSSGYVTTGTWEDNAVAGLTKRLSRRITWDVNVGYLKGTVLGRLTSYHGFFVGMEMRKRLSRSLTAVATYRRFEQTVSQVPVRRNIAMFTLLWTPTRHDMKRTAEYPVFTPAPDSASDHEN